MNSKVVASIVIPAHNEAAVIDRCLSSFWEGTSEYEVVVVCNGCTDDSAARARTFPGVNVIEVAAASKIAALNAGDAVATILPRIYLDADVQIDPASLRAVVDALRNGAPAAAPLLSHDMHRSSLAVRCYFALWCRLGYASQNILGSGFYGLSADGRSRFGNFPDVICDDGYVYSYFSPAERINPPGAKFTVQAPRTLRATLRRRVRIAQGVKQLERQGGRTMEVAGPRWYHVILQRPHLIPAALVFLSVNAIASWRAERRLKTGETLWLRDDSREEPEWKPERAASLGPRER